MSLPVFFVLLFLAAIVVVQFCIIRRQSGRLKLWRRIVPLLPLRFFLTDRTGKLLLSGASSAPQSAAAAAAKHIRNFPDDEREKLVYQARVAFLTDSGSRCRIPGRADNEFMMHLKPDGRRDAVLYCAQMIPGEIFGSSELLHLRRLQEAGRKIQREGILELDAAGNIVAMNNALSRLTGFLLPECVGKPASSALVCEPKMRFDVPLAASSRRLIDRGGAVHEVEIQTAFIGSGDVSDGILVCVRSVDEKRELKRENDKKDRALEFVSHMARVGYFHYNPVSGRLTGSQMPSRLWGTVGGVPVRPEEWICGEDLPEYLKQRDKLQKREIPRMEVSYRSDYGSEMRYFRMQAVLESMPDGDTGIFGLIQDVTELGRKERELADANRLIRSLFETLPCLLFVKEVSDDYRYCLCNPEFCRILGRTEQEIIGRQDSDFLSETEVETGRRSDSAANRSKLPVQSVERIACPDGRERVFNLIKVAYNISGGKRMLSCVAWDITELENSRRQEAEQRDLLQKIFDHLPLMVVVRDAETRRYLFWNRGAEELSGLPAASVVGRSDAELPPGLPTTAGNREELDNAVKLGGCDVEKSIHTPQNGALDMRMSTRCLRLPRGRSLLLTVGVDLTNQKNSLRKREALIRRLNGHIAGERIINTCLRQLSTEFDYERSVGEMLRTVGENFGADRCYIYEMDASDNFCNCTFEWARSEFDSQKDNRQILSADAFPQWFEQLRQDRFIRIDDTENLPARFQEECGAPLAMQSIKSLLAAGVYENDRLIGFLGVDFVRERADFDDNSRDFLFNAVSLFGLAKERRRQLSEIAQSETLRRQTLDLIPLPALLIGADFHVRYANPAAGAMFGVEPESIIGGECRDICGLTDAETKGRCLVALTLESKRSVSLEISRSGRSYMVNTLPLARDGKIEEVMELFSDVSELAQSRHFLRQVADRADADARAKSPFLATMSHELRTPLNAVIGFAELLEDGDNDPAVVRESVHAIKVAGTALLDQINDILDFSKLDAGEMRLIPAPTDLGELLRDTLTLFEERLRSRNLFCRMEAPEKLPTILCDGRRLRQILINLLGNAVKFTEKGGVTLRVEFLPGEQEKGTLKIAVCDTGIGVAPEDRERIFLSFVQGSHNKQSTQGTGLGLPICRKLATRMGGTISCESQFGHGSVFLLEIPVVLTAASAAQESAASAETLPDCDILLVDDVAMNCRVMEAMCGKLGVRSRSAGSGEDALRAVSERRPDIVIADMRMPGMDGMELAKRLRAVSVGGKPAIVLASGDIEAPERLADSFDGALVKPITLDSLRGMILHVLGKEEKK